MEQLLNALPLLACPVGMGAMMWWMSRKGHDQAGNTADSGSDPAVEVAQLRAELDQLRAAHDARLPPEGQRAGNS